VDWDWGNPRVKRIIGLLLEKKRVNLGGGARFMGRKSVFGCRARGRGRGEE